MRVTANELSFHVIDEGEGLAVLLLHGFPDSSALWRHQIPALVDAGHRVIAADLRGYGDSDRPAEVAAYRMEVLVRDVLGILGALKREMSWYVLFFLFLGIAEESLRRDDWALFRLLLRDRGDINRYLTELDRLGSLIAGLNWYRANISDESFGQLNPTPTPAVRCPVLGVWSDGDHYCSEAQMQASQRHVSGAWRYARIDGAATGFR